MTPAANTEPASGAAMDRVVRRPPWRRRSLAAGAALLTVLGIYLLVQRVRSDGKRSLEVSGDRITTAQVKDGKFDDFIQIRGRFTPLTTIFIDTVQGGQVDAIHVENGAQLERGQLLVELSNTTLQLEVISREAQITEQLNNLRSLELAHEKNRLAQKREAVEVEYQITRLTRAIARTNGLVESGARPRGEYEDMQDELAYFKKRHKILTESQGAANRLERAQLVELRKTAKQLEASLVVARKNLEGLQVKALVPGQLSAFDLQVGQSLAPGERLGQIDDTSSYKILADIDEFYLGRVDIGQHAEYEVDETSYALTVAKIRPQVQNGRFQVDLVFVGDAPPKMRRGQTAQARLQLGQPTDAVLVPNAAFFNDTGGAWVFVVAGDRSHAVRRSVRLGRRNPQHIEVLEGLSPGEEIVTSPYTSFLAMDRLDFTAGQSTGATQ